MAKQLLQNNRVDRMFETLRKKKATGLIVYLTGGDPAPHLTADIIMHTFQAGADLIELGMPFSDPLADGPTLQRAAQRSLAAGTRLQHILSAGREVRRRGEERPLALLCYVNLVLRAGFGDLPVQLAEHGFDALIVPDLPWEERELLAPACQAAGIHLVPFLAPTSTDERIAAVGADQGGFIYCVSLTGVTGARTALPPQAVNLLQRARSSTDRPLALGFGISDSQQAAQLRPWADAVIVGSAVVQRLENLQLDPTLDGVSYSDMAPVTDFIHELKGALAPAQKD